MLLGPLGLPFTSRVGRDLIPRSDFGLGFEKGQDPVFRYNGWEFPFVKTRHPKVRHVLRSLLHHQGCGRCEVWGVVPNLRPTLLVGSRDGLPDLHSRCTRGTERPLTVLLESPDRE